MKQVDCKKIMVVGILMKLGGKQMAQWREAPWTETWIITPHPLISPQRSGRVSGRKKRKYKPPKTERSMLDMLMERKEAWHD